eukprot:scaffold73583_cov35-Tisochrysis_lutea.AAC.4
MVAGLKVDRDRIVVRMLMPPQKWRTSVTKRSCSRLRCKSLHLVCTRSGTPLSRAGTPSSPPPVRCVRASSRAARAQRAAYSTPQKVAGEDRRTGGRRGEQRAMSGNEWKPSHQ